uniref:Uncharacterized protein n=1 Tax=Peromyscus maniculatus bairdii TaxID=230844 RepID=A0A8C8UF37_PERMB
MTRLALNSEICLPLPPTARIKGVEWSTWNGVHSRTSACLFRVLTSITVPSGVGVSALNVFLKLHHHGGFERSEFIANTHLHIRTKPFLWGDDNHSLSDNPQENPFLTGYEDKPGNLDHHLGNRATALVCTVTLHVGWKSVWGTRGFCLFCIK